LEWGVERPVGLPPAQKVHAAPPDRKDADDMSFYRDETASTATRDVRFDDGPESGRGSPVLPPRARTWRERFANNWPVVPMRIFLGSLFLFAAYAKFSYPGFFDDNVASGLKQVIIRVKPDSPIGSMLQPLIDHAVRAGSRHGWGRDRDRRRPARGLPDPDCRAGWHRPHDDHRAQLELGADQGVHGHERVVSHRWTSPWRSP